MDTGKYISFVCWCGFYSHQEVYISVMISVYNKKTKPLTVKCLPLQQVMRAAGKHLRGSQLREVFLSGVEVRESSGTPGMEHTLLAALTTNLHHLTLLSLAGLKLTPTQAQIFGKVRPVVGVDGGH